MRKNKKRSDDKIWKRVGKKTLSITYGKGRGPFQEKGRRKKEDDEVGIFGKQNRKPTKGPLEEGRKTM